MYEITVDLETSVHGPKNSPEAQYDANFIVYYGWHDDCKVRTSKDGTDLYATMFNAYQAGHIVKIIGHNLKFDLKHMMKERPDLRWEEFEYHDTMHTEYRQSGHRYRFPSLEDTCARHSIAFTKGLDLAALIKAGVQIEDIPDSDLEPYLRADVTATRELYDSQCGQPGYIEYDQTHIAALAEMELHGLPLDIPKTQDLMTDMYDQLEIVDFNLWNHTLDMLEWSDGDELKPKEINYTSPRTVSYLLTGSPTAGLTKRVRKNIVWRQLRVPMLSKAEIAMIWGKTKPGHLGYPMSKAILDEVAKLASCSHYMKDLMEYRKLNKVIGTYLGPFLEAAAVHPTIHPKMNVATTATGRLSSSAPNGQNMPELVRNLFLSDNGQFHEIDFKQLEVVALAHLSKDLQLLADIAAGEDIHFNTGKTVMGWTYLSDMTEKERKLVKNVNFGLIYGGGPKGLAKQTGQPQAMIKKLIDAFYKRYPGVKQWQKDFYTTVTTHLRPAGFENGEAKYDALVIDPVSQRKFYFKESIAPDWVQMKTGRSFSFKPTETKNYPVQGFAGGDIVMTALALLWCKTRRMNNMTQIRMTVHDSILVDTILDAKTLTLIMEDVCRTVEARYGLPFELGFDITSGFYWQ